MMNSKYVRFVIFLVVNFLALGLGIIFMEGGPRSDWYLALNKAPWTPPGFMFGLSWSVIMVCYAFFMTELSAHFKLYDPKVIRIYTYQWLLNVGWNYAFFNQKQFFVGLIVLSALWLIVLFKAIKFKRLLGNKFLFILPYVIWMTIALSLNAYVVLYN